MPATLFALHAYATLHGRHDRLKDGINCYKDAVDLVYGLADTLSEPELRSMTAQELKNKVERKHRGVLLSADGAPESRWSGWVPARREDMHTFWRWCLRRFAEGRRAVATWRTTLRTRRFQKRLDASKVELRSYEALDNE